MNTTSPIGVFDSGVGGVSVLRALMRQMPQEHYIYFGDSANAPYGVKTTEQVRTLTLDAARYLLEDRECKALVVACNTATAAAIETLRSAYPNQIIIGIEPALKLAVDRHPGGTIGIMATDVTLREQKLAALMDRVAGECTVLRLSSPGLVELVESGMGDSDRAREVLEGQLGHLRGKLDALVLGCTHYPFLNGAIRAAVGDGVDILDGGEGTARETMRRLRELGLENTEGEGSLTVENSSGDPEKLRLTMELLES